MSDLKTLEREAVEAEKSAQKLMADRDQLRDELREATDRAAAAQKRLLDAQVAESLRDRPDGEAVAAALGIDL